LQYLRILLHIRTLILVVFLHNTITESLTALLDYQAMNRILPGLLLASTYASLAHATYNLQIDYTGAKFFDGFEFFTGADPTDGTVTFLDEVAANDTSLAGYIETANNTMAIYMAADTTTSGGSGRASVRVSSIETFQHGLFIVDILHIPTGCGTWPAFWM
jgi:beta-glucanase (GH16 family)